MAIDASIPLRVRSMDLSQAGQNFVNAKNSAERNQLAGRQLDIAENRQATQDKLTESTILQNKYKNLEDREQRRLKSATVGAAQLNPFLEKGDIEGARTYLKTRRAELGQQIAQGLDVDTAETDEALKMLDTDPEALKGVTQRAIGLGTQLGFLKDIDADKTSKQKEFEYFQTLSPTEQKNFINVQRQNQGFFIDPQTGAATPVEGFTGIRKEIKSAEAAGTKEGQLGAEKEFNLPKAQASLESANIKFADQMAKIDQVLPNVNDLTAGFAGTLLSKIPGTKATDLKATIDTIVANLGFEELQTMRINSPTGGALGAISERELALLTAARQNLSNSQTPEQLKENLGDLKDQLRLSNKAIKAAFEQDFGRFNKVPPKKESQIIDFNDL